MAEKLKIISLGGLNEIGKNITVLEYGGDMIVVDCGLGFPEDDMYGVDLVVPDVTYLIKNQQKLRGFFLTHGHEDHIGGLPYVLEQVNAPVHTTRLTAGLVQIKLEEHGLLDSTKIVTHEAGEVVKAGCFKVEFIHVNHSIADAVAFAIHTPVGVVVMTGDFKIDSTPISGSIIDLARFGALGNKGVLALLCDSTNVEREGFSPSERKVSRSFDSMFKGCDQRIIVTTFASNVDRMIVMEKGTAVMTGAPSEVFSHAAELVSMGLNVPCMTQVLLRLQQLGVNVPASAYTVEQAADILEPLLKGGARIC